jgi:hypothetical protein
VSLTRVYLDQRDWIALARQHYGKTHDEDLAGVLALVREASTKGLASFPLSASHYFETYRIGDPERRQKLGRFMAQVSRFHTIASAPDLLPAEIEVSVCNLVGLKPRQPPVPFGVGVRHAFRRQALRFFDDPDLEKLATARFGVEGLHEYFESQMLIGPDERLPADGVQLPSNEYAQRQLDFERETARKLQEAGHTSDLAHRLVLAQEALGVVDLVNVSASNVGVNPVDLLTTRDDWIQFMLSLPAKGTVCRLRMTAHEDQTFRWHIGDLNDISALGTAAAYCDIVVAEKHWSSILRRHAGHLRAYVTSDLQELPALLV